MFSALAPVQNGPLDRIWLQEQNGVVTNQRAGGAPSVHPDENHRGRLHETRPPIYRHRKTPGLLCAAVQAHSRRFTTGRPVRSHGELKRLFMSETALPSESDTGVIVSGHGILTVNEVAAELRCSKAHVHHLIIGTVPGVRPLPSLWLGRRRLVLRASFNAWLKTSEKHPDSML